MHGLYSYLVLNLRHHNVRRVSGDGKDLKPKDLKGMLCLRQVGSNVKGACTASLSATVRPRASAER